MRGIKRVFLLMLLGVYFAIAYTLMHYFEITCVFLKLFDVPCPGCGMTRAFLSLLNWDFTQAVKYNATVLFMPYIFLYIIFDFKHKIHKFILSGVAAVAVLSWLVKLF